MNKANKSAAPKKIIKRRLYITVGNAKPAPTIYQVLGELKINTAEFLKEVTNMTKAFKSGTFPIDVISYPNGKYKLNMRKETTTALIKREFNIETGASAAKREKLLEIDIEQLRSIAKHKMSDLTAATEEAAMQIIAGAARSMGITVRE